MGPQHREFRKEILQTMQVGVGPQQREIGSPIPTDNASWRGPNIEKLDHQFQQTMQVGVGPNTEAGEKSAYKNVQVGGATTERNRITNSNKQCKLAGPQHREIGTPISTDNASWGRTSIKKYFFFRN
ncbi:TPA: hypothetical protein ACN4WB_001827 [Staphylococcus aureus]|nr:hypothetical protein [Staphylococcus aureus]HCY6477943.1 hypothetical protein [Staphylococcus aureus]HCY9519879.1 hypothetical protein [Staphylococcus aureus]HDD0957808.1 hypothetical protein [Staphylococcus aureus]HDE6321651.1 hypothetical protein [Staphylococcus aureus]